MTGTLEEAIPFFTFPDSSQPAGTGVLFRLQLTGDGNLALSFPASLTFAHQFSLYRTSADMAQQIPAGAEVAALVMGLSLLEEGVPLQFPADLVPGEQVTMVLECTAFCDDPSLSFAFDIIDAERLSLAPGPSAELASLAAASSGMDRMVVLGAQRVAQNMGAASLSLRSGPSAGAEVSRRSDQTSLVGNLHSWAEFTALDRRADTGAGGGTGSGFQIGADLALGADMVAGLAIGHTKLSATEVASGQKGALTWVQPYATWRPGAWHGHAGLILGRGDYDQSSASGEGTGETRLLAVTLEGGFDRPLGDRMMLTPSLGFITGRQTVTGTGGILASAGSERVEFTQSSLGATITYQRPAGTVFAGVHADYLEEEAGSVLTEGFLSEDGWTGRIAIGGAVEFGSGLGLATSVELGGLGGAAETLSGGLQLSFQF